MTSDCLDQFTLSSSWNQKEKTQQSLLYRKSCEVWGKNPSNMKRFNRHSMSLRFMTPNRGCIPESTDNRPRDLFRGSLGMFLSSLLYERKCLKIDLFKIDCCLNASFIICVFFFLCVELNNKRMQSVHRASRPHGLFHYSAHLASILSKRFATFDTVCFGHRSGAICKFI